MGSLEGKMKFLTMLIRSSKKFRFKLKGQVQLIQDSDIFRILSHHKQKGEIDGSIRTAREQGLLPFSVVPRGPFT